MSGLAAVIGVAMVVVGCAVNLTSRLAYRRGVRAGVNQEHARYLRVRATTKQEVSA